MICMPMPRISYYENLISYCIAKEYHDMCRDIFGIAHIVASVVLRSTAVSEVLPMGVFSKGPSM